MVSKEQNFIFFMKGTKVKQKQTKKTNSRMLIGFFPLYTAYTEFRPDITIYSNSVQKIILIALTYHCEENMEKWHDHKINKYLALKSAIKRRCWKVDLYAIQVGARGSSSTSFVFQICLL